MIEQYLPLFIMVSIICASIGAFAVTRNFSRSSPISNKIKRQYDMYIADLEAAKKRLTGKVNQSKFANQDKHAREKKIVTKIEKY